MKRSMKRWLSYILALMFILCLCACGQNDTAYTWQEQYDLGVRYLTEGNYEEAIIAFTAAIEIDPEKAAAYVGRADAYMSIGENDKNFSAALSDYEKALFLDQNIIEAWLGMADIYRWYGDAEREYAVLIDGLEKAENTKALEDRLEQVDVSGFLSLQTAEYTIERKDHSFYSDNGELLIELGYDLVKLTGNLPAYTKINQYILQDYETFLSPDRLAEYKTYLDDPFFSPGYCSTAFAAVTNNDSSVFSIAIGTEWFMGGVHNADTYGLTFDLRTGDVWNLHDLTYQDNGDLINRLQQSILDYMNDHDDDWWEDASTKVMQYTLDDLLFYIEDNQIILCIPTYELTPGASGSHRIPSGVYLDRSEADGSKPLNDPNDDQTNTITVYQYGKDFLGKTIQDITDHGLDVELKQSEYFDGLFTGKQLPGGVIGWHRDWSVVAEGVSANLYTASAAEGISMSDEISIVEMIYSVDSKIDIAPGISWNMSYDQVEAYIDQDIPLNRAELDLYFDGASISMCFTVLEMDYYQLILWWTSPATPQIDVALVCPNEADIEDLWLDAPLIVPADSQSLHSIDLRDLLGGSASEVVSIFGTGWEPTPMGSSPYLYGYQNSGIYLYFALDRDYSSNAVVNSILVADNNWTVDGIQTGASVQEISSNVGAEIEVTWNDFNGNWGSILEHGGYRYSLVFDSQAGQNLEYFFISSIT